MKRGTFGLSPRGTALAGTAHPLLGVERTRHRSWFNQGHPEWICWQPSSHTCTVQAGVTTWGPPRPCPLPKVPHRLMRTRLAPSPTALRHPSLMAKTVSDIIVVTRDTTLSTHCVARPHPHNPLAEMGRERLRKVQRLGQSGSKQGGDARVRTPSRHPRTMPPEQGSSATKRQCLRAQRL